MSISTEYRRVLEMVFRVSMPYHHIYHYTTPETALRILETRDGCGFYCTHYKFLNDDGEFAIGIDIVLTWLRRLVSKVSQDDLTPFPDRVAALIYPTVKAAINSDFTPWILSFSKDWDQLSQWASYTDHKEGGYALGVNFDRLIEKMTPLRSTEWIDSRDVWVVAPCVYVKVHEKVHSRNSEFEILDRLLEYHGGIAFLKSKDAVLRFATIAILFAALVKSEDFKTENEWRVVRLTDSTFDYRSTEIVGGKPRIPLPVTSAAELVGKLVVSHHGDRERLELMADILAKKHPQFVIRKSRTSYTGR